MLVLTRKERESVSIGNDIKVIVTRIKGNVVRLAIDAPDGTKILRDELIRKPEIKRYGVK